MTNLDQKSKERIADWILEMKRVIREWDSTKFSRLSAEKIAERNAKRKPRKPIHSHQARSKMRNRIANGILRSL